jgi:hypothetical protein
MSILVNTGSIVIQNSAGQTKFTSDNKLLYQKTYQTGYVGLSNGATSIVPFPKLTDKDFLVLSVKIVSASGQADFINTIVNKEIPANGGVIVDFYGRAVYQQAAADTEILGIDSIADFLAFKTVRYDYQQWVYPGTTSVGLYYYARIWSFL